MKYQHYTMTLIALFPLIAGADNKPAPSPPFNDPDVRVDVDSQIQSSPEVSITENVEYLSDEQFMALALTFPNAAGCFKGTQGGGSNEGDSVFFGIHLLNTDCFLSELAKQEQNIEIRARLQCGSKKYRDAIAYDVPASQRREACINVLVEAYQGQHTNELLAMPYSTTLNDPQEDLHYQRAAEMQLELDRLRAEQERQNRLADSCFEECQNK